MRHKDKEFFLSLKLTHIFASFERTGITVNEYIVNFKIKKYSFFNAKDNSLSLHRSRNAPLVNFVEETGATVKHERLPNRYTNGFLSAKLVLFYVILCIFILNFAEKF